MEEYTKAQQFVVKDLDKDTYVKFENAYVLDRYEARKPYFITGDDGLKKRIDLYKIVAREGLQEIGTMIFYTTEKGKLYKAVVPDFTADAKVWDRYFNDIDNINKEEKNFILKLSYVLSKEMSFQQYKVLNAGKDLAEESATYGNDICFPGNDLVAMAGGGSKLLKDVLPGDRVISIDPATRKAKTVTVKRLITHEAKNYAVTELVLASGREQKDGSVRLSTRIIRATPNHPMLTRAGEREMGGIDPGDEILCREKGGTLKPYTVLLKKERGEGLQEVYNMETDGGSTFVVNGVMVKQK